MTRGWYKCPSARVGRGLPCCAEAHKKATWPQEPIPVQEVTVPVLQLGRFDHVITEPPERGCSTNPSTENTDLLRYFGRNLRRPTRLRIRRTFFGDIDKRVAT